MSIDSIGPGRDEALGRLLREALGSGDDAAFAARVMAAVAREPHDGTWDVLAHWLRPGLAAALLLAALGGAAVARGLDAGVPSTEQLLVAGDDGGARDMVLADMLEPR